MFLAVFVHSGAALLTVFVFCFDDLEERRRAWRWFVVVVVEISRWGDVKEAVTSPHLRPHLTTAAVETAAS